MKRSPQKSSAPVYRIQRRSLLAATTSLAAAAVWSSRAEGITLRNIALADNPFSLGVASGDPLPTGVVLWTRLAPKPLEGGGMPDEAVEVAWEVAEDEQLTKVVRKGTAVATPTGPTRCTSKSTASRPDRWYWYRFRAGRRHEPRRPHAHVAAGRRDARAAAVRLRLLPALRGGPVHRLRAHGPGRPRPGRPPGRLHLRRARPRRAACAGTIGPRSCRSTTTATATRSTRPTQHLQAAHAAFPWLVTWDDHEFDNNCAGRDLGATRTSRRSDFLKRRAAAYQAYYEHMPLRRASLPKGPDMQLYRRVPFGRLAEFFVLDTRQYRTDQPLRRRQQAAVRRGARSAGHAARRRAGEVALERARRLRRPLERAGPAGDDGPRRPAGGRGRSATAWTSGPATRANRRRLLKFFADRKIANPVVLTGDIHSNWVNDLIADFDDLDQPRRGHRVRRHVDLAPAATAPQAPRTSTRRWPRTRSSSSTTPSAATSAAR